MQKISGWALLLGCLCGPALGQSLGQVDQQQRFLEQMRVGEALYREDLVRDALARLNLIAPDLPPVLVAGIRQALLQNDQARAGLLLDRLQRQAPDSPELFQARSLMKLQSANGQKDLHQARALAQAGKAQDAVGVYRQLFGDAPPDLASALEYWRARGAMAGQQALAIEQLRVLDRQYPGNVGLQVVLANLLFEQKKDADGLAILHRLASDPMASNAAAEQEYNYLSRQPVSPAGVKGWQDFLARYPDSPLNSKAAGQLQLQQQRLADPAWRGAAKPRPYVDPYWSLLRQGDQAMRRKDWVSAEKAYKRAGRVKPNDPWALVRRAAIAQAKADDIAAESLLMQAHRLQPASAPVTQALVGFYQAHAPQKLEAFLDTLPPARQREFAALRQRLVLARLSAQADAAEKRADWAQVNDLLIKARTLDPNDPWLAFRLAKAQQALGQTGVADDTLRHLMQRQAHNPEALYAHALYLSGNGADGAALDELGRIPKSAWNQGMRDLDGQIRRRQALQQARQIAETQLGLIETLIARGQVRSARQKLEQLTEPPAEPDYQRRQANAWAAVGNVEKAEALFTQLLNSTPDDALAYRDGARLMSKEQPQRALDHYARAMAAAGLLTPAEADPRDDRAMTLASRKKNADDWLPGSLRSDVDRLYQRQNPTVNLYRDYTWRNDDSVPGLSDLTTQTSILRIDAPLGQGQGFVQAENVDLDAGRFDTDADGLHRQRFGTCAIRLRNRATGVVQPNGCSGDTQSARGNGLAIGWHDDHWALDVGHSPEGFEVSNWLGGVSFASDWNTLGWKLTASRRPMGNSLLSYAGAVDPVTGIRWGGVTANGLTLDLSHDTGGVDGVWASLGAHWLRGENVADNQRHSATAGYYYKLIERADEQLRTGLTVMYWGYDKDLSEYTLGQGGYYSPQQYYSIGVPLNYAWRNAEWSVRLESSLGWSYAKTRASERYPLEGQAAQWLSSVEQAGFDIADDRTKSASASSGANVRLQGFIERRLGDHLVLGGGLTWQHSEDYAPSRALLYLRYVFDPWQGNLPLPVEPITPYADWR
ncbi:BCSC C-terminal domain-containing protein [Pseudomonas sp. B21-028]|uniref:cellulose synthase subunit BcsC-related outer membrane protein n=1 Tax=Pseudomonas sp. B21-028 TaxID=2895480 RepID=UPI002160AFF6|nr:cellulose synthase subunit BcsC-related outer membrane protein [Pseudomonas sp. B21-028]UVL86471.1 BCSC C-terminal domain-containing protein [Pseudomonas sp. B21-028]